MQILLFSRAFYKKTPVSTPIMLDKSLPER